MQGSIEGKKCDPTHAREKSRSPNHDGGSIG